MQRGQRSYCAVVAPVYRPTWLRRCCYNSRPVYRPLYKSL